MSTCDHLYLKQFLCTLYPLFKVPSRNTIKKDILSIFFWNYKSKEGIHVCNRILH
ncbi:hypothetical protein LINPERPRIM_LOCUS31214 [Linum perenne]